MYLCMGDEAFGWTDTLLCCMRIFILLHVLLFCANVSLFFTFINIPSIFCVCVTVCVTVLSAFFVLLLYGLRTFPFYRKSFYCSPVFVFFFWKLAYTRGIFAAVLLFAISNSSRLATLLFSSFEFNRKTLLRSPHPVCFPSGHPKRFPPLCGQGK